MPRRNLLVAAVGCLLLGGLLVVCSLKDVHAQPSPLSAQIQRALAGFLTTANTWTGAQSFTGASTTTLTGLAATATDGFVFQNTTAATAGVPVQEPPGIRLRGNVWNTTAVAANNTNDWRLESTPTSGLVPSGTLLFRTSLNGAAYVTPMTIDSAGNLVVATSINAGGNINAPAAQAFTWTSRNRVLAPADGQINFTDLAVTHGVGFDLTTDGTMKVRTRAQTGYATVDALAYNAGGDILYLQTTPTVTSGFSTTTPSIAGKASVFAVTIAATPGVTGTVAFNGTFTNVPSCSCTNTITANAVQCVPTTTTAVINGVWVANDVLRCLVLGY